MIEKLKSPKVRKHFVVLCAFAVLLAGIANFYVNRSLKPNCENSQTVQTGSTPSTFAQNPSAPPICSPVFQFIIDTVPNISAEFISASIIALFFLGILTLLKDDEDAVSDIEILFQPEQKRSHMEALKKTRTWYHDGHLASWVRKIVLPEFQRRCKENMCDYDIKVAIMDPRDEEVCKTYLDHINGLPEDEQRYSDLSSVKAQICASIYLLVKGYQPRHLNVEIYLKDRIDFIRDDIADTRAFWTTVGTSVPAISLINRSNKFIYYNLLKKNFYASIRLYEKLDVAGAHAVLQQNGVQPQPEAVKSVLQFLFPNDQLLYSDDSLKRIAKCLPVH